MYVILVIMVLVATFINWFEAIVITMVIATSIDLYVIKIMVLVAT